MTAAFPAQTKGKMKQAELLSRIGALCGGGFTVVEAAELSPELPCGALKEQLISLAAEDLISLSYAEDGVFCLALTEKGREALECPAPELPKRRGFARAAFLALAAFLGGFAGAAAAIAFGGGA